MRIPPSVAQHIGQLFATARANEHAAQIIDGARASITNARTAAIELRFDTAIADATTAATLIRPTVAANDGRIHPYARTAMSATLSVSGIPFAIETLAARDAKNAATILELVLADLNDARGFAADLAASARAEADELSRRYL
jgi:hypothetical protein